MIPQSQIQIDQKRAQRPNGEQKRYKLQPVLRESLFAIGASAHGNELAYEKRDEGVRPSDAEARTQEQANYFLVFAQEVPKKLEEILGREVFSRLTKYGFTSLPHCGLRHSRLKDRLADNSCILAQ